MAICARPGRKAGMLRQPALLSAAAHSLHAEIQARRGDRRTDARVWRPLRHNARKVRVGVAMPSKHGGSSGTSGLMQTQGQVPAENAGAYDGPGLLDHPSMREGVQQSQTGGLAAGLCRDELSVAYSDTLLGEDSALSGHAVHGYWDSDSYSSVDVTATLQLSEESLEEEVEEVRPDSSDLYDFLDDDFHPEMLEQGILSSLDEDDAKRNEISSVGSTDISSLDAAVFVDSGAEYSVDQPQDKESVPSESADREQASTEFQIPLAGMAASVPAETLARSDGCKEAATNSSIENPTEQDSKSVLVSDGATAAASIVLASIASSSTSQTNASMAVESKSSTISESGTGTDKVKKASDGDASQSSSENAGDAESEAETKKKKKKKKDSDEPDPDAYNVSFGCFILLFAMKPQCFGMIML